MIDPTPVHATPENLIPEVGLTQKTHKTFSFHTTPEEFKNTKITDYCILDLYSIKTRSGKSPLFTSIILTTSTVFDCKACFQNVNSFRLKRKFGVLKFLLFKELRFRNRLVWVVGLTVEQNCVLIFSSGKHS